MGGVTLPVGYSDQSMKTYANNEKFRNSLKNNQDLVKISVVDSRGNISSIVKPMDIVIYEPPRLTEYEATRVNDIETGVRLKATGKKYDLYDINYIKYTVSTAPWVNEASSGTTYGPFNLDLEEITYNTDNTEFELNSQIQGDLGASGFTFDQKFYIKIEIADAWNTFYPHVYYTEVVTGKILMSYADNGVSFGGLYDEALGGPLQVGKIAIGKTKVYSSSTDLDDIDYNVEFAYCNSCTNRPVGVNGYFQCFLYSNTDTSYRYQKYTTVYNVSYTRTMTGGVWGVWSIVPKEVTGTWTPSLGNRGTGGDPTVTYTTQTGFYKRVGNIVYYSCRIIGTITAVNGQNYAIIKGLPFVSENVTDKFSPCTMIECYRAIDEAKAMPIALILPNKDAIYLQSASSKGAGVEYFTAGLGTFYITCSGFYFV